MIAKTETHRRQFGITLLELMIAVAIVGILAAIAYPSYVEYVKRSNRADAMQALQQGAQQAERWFTQQNSYTDLSTDDGKVFLYSGESAVKSKGIFTFTVQAASPTAFELRATAAAGKVNAGDGYFSIDEQGRKIWQHPDDGTKSWSDR